MRLPDICQTGIKTRVKYLSLVGHMASVDGQIDSKELALLQQMTQKFNIAEKYHKEIFQNEGLTQKDIEEGFQILNKHRLQYSFLLDLIAMALADGVILDPERMMLSQIVVLIGMSFEDFDNLINFAQTTASLVADEPIDPFFHYVINMFFHFASQKHVRLFKQTTFAIDQKVDAFLKSELA